MRHRSKTVNQELNSRMASDRISLLYGMGPISMDKEYILYCDESEIKGRYYSNFYGGVMVGASQYERISIFLEDEKRRLNLLGEVKMFGYCAGSDSLSIK